MNTRKILLVEDNEDDYALLKRAFKKKNMLNDLVRAKNGVEALEILLGSGNGADRMIPSLIILDLKLPKLNGLDVLKGIRANEFTKGLPVIILTTSAEQEDIVQSYNLGANSYIRKPVEFDKFLEAVEQLGTYWMVLNQSNPKYDE